MTTAIDSTRGETKWRTCFSSISYHGRKLDVLKSALQKYARRRETDKMLWCAAEIYLFKALAKSEQEIQTAKSIITNLINRLIIILDEEVLFADWATFLVCRKWLDDFDISERKDFSKVIRICHAITNSKMLRLNSDISAYWFRGATKGYIEKPKSIPITDNISDNLKSITKKGDFESGEISRICMENFISTVTQGNPECYYWGHILFNCKETGANRYKRKDSIYMLWEYLFKQSDNEHLTKCLDYKLKEFFVKDRKERHMWLSGAISLILHKDKINWDESMFNSVGGINIDIDNEIIKLFEKKTNITLDEYVLDMHCSAGRKLNKNKADFALEGCLVIDEDKEFFIKEWRDIYIKDKVEFTKEVKKTKENKATKSKGDKYVKSDKISLLEPNLNTLNSNDIDFNLIKLCTDITCGNKVVCFEYNGKIWKEGRKSMNYNRDYICVDSCKNIFGLNEIGMKRIQTNFKIEKIDKNNKYWKDNWKVTLTKDPIIYCCMNKINGVMLQEKKELLEDNNILKEVFKIAIFRGIFRATDFCMRNIMITEDKSLISIDEHEIGNRKHIIGSREKWLISKINKGNFANEVLEDIMTNMEDKIKFMCEKLIIYGFDITIIAKNYNNLKQDLINEGIKF